ncbi:MAG: type II secretion system secretin GspD [Paracoccaceae bacterium]
MNRFSPRTVILAFLATFFLLSCESTDKPRPRSPLLAAMANGGGLYGPRGYPPGFDPTGLSDAEIVAQLGTGQFMAGMVSRNAPLVDVSGGDVSLNLVNVPLAAAARAVLGDALGLTFSIQEGVAGNVTLQTTQPISKKALLETFQTILEAQGITLEKTGNLISVVNLSQATRRVAPLGGANGIGPRVVAAPIKYVSASEIVRLLGPIVGRGVSMQASDNRNILLISGTREEVNATIEAINLFDVDVLSGKSIGLYKLRSADPEAVAVELSVIFESNEGGALQNVVQFIPSRRLNAILVISTRPDYLQKAQNWIQKLDATADGSRRRPAVYPLQNRSAEELAPILAEMAGAQATTAPTEEGAAATSSQVRVVADDARNAIIVWGNDNEQNDLAQLIARLDTTPVQVLLEATIAEVTLTDELNFGLRWFFEGGSARTTFSDVASGAVASTFPGLSFLFQGANGAVALNALASITDVNIISSPSLMVLDNQEATLQIGDEVPIATQQSQGSAGPNAPVITTISFRDTGIILKVRPRISSAGRVILEIEQEVSSVNKTTTSGIDSPTISQRKISTKVVVDDGTTLALGGLIQEGRTNTRDQVPGAGDIPILGNLFRSKEDRQTRTELLILITPRVIRDGSEARAVTEEFRNRLLAPNQLIFGGPATETGMHRFLE